MHLHVAEYTVLAIIKAFFIRKLSVFDNRAEGEINYGAPTVCFCFNCF